jgi:SAP domain-containing ribonucleoprotein
MKSRAERFGIAFNPNPTSTTKSKPKPSTSTPAPVASTAPAPAAAKKEKAGAIDKAPLGISEEVLAKRAAKFGLPDKKEEKPASSVTKAKETEAVKPKSEVELTPYVIYSKVEGSADEYSEMKEKLAVEEEKKRKRAEKFGTAKPANGTEESVSTGDVHEEGQD